ncbi:MAG: ATP-grasp domain-containing protein [Candidatus Taylorbacteria bacterium]|nr:ATP-grasp domain-containing protein [Candidatus Taylorbacteria bacterium]
MSLRKKIRVGVLRGGPSREHEVSIKTGSHVMKNLPDKYLPVDIFVDKDGVWHVAGVAQNPDKALRKVDVIWNALHGEYGEDGTVQNLLVTFKVPFTGSDRVSSALTMHKTHAKNVLKRHGIKTPYHKIIKKSDTTETTILDLFNTAPNPSIVKPVNMGSSIGVSVATTLLELRLAIEKGFSVSPTLIVEEYIQGREATCGIIDNFRGEDAYILMPVEVENKKESRFFDYDSKYVSKSRLHHPGRFSAMEKEAIQKATRLAHTVLGLRHYSRSDFIVHPKRGIYFLETNSLPGLYADSPFTESLKAVGSSAEEFIGHVLDLALSGK